MFLNKIVLRLTCAICSKEVVMEVVRTTPDIGVLCPSHKNEPTSLTSQIQQQDLFIKNLEKEIVQLKEEQGGEVKRLENLVSDLTKSQADLKNTLTGQQEKLDRLVGKVKGWRDLIKAFIVK